MLKIFTLIIISLAIPLSSSPSIEKIEAKEKELEPEIIVEEKDFTLLENQTVYGYSSEVAQTDDSPFITASLFNLRDSDSFQVIANNCYPFGTKVNINGYDLIVRDRMNSRYGCDVWDIWFKTKQEAINWGKIKLTIKIYVQQKTKKTD